MPNKLITFWYKFSKSIIPCALLTLSIGFCYAFSLFAPHIATALAVPFIGVQFAFCLNIFFLGMGAAFFGNLVEKRIKVAALVSALLLLSGFLITHFGIALKNIWLIYLGIGFFCGIAEGCGYVVPVKNMLLWWNKSTKKGLIAAISIISFGLGSTVCSYLFKYLFPIYGIEQIFLVLAGVYGVPTLLSSWLINKPKYAQLKLKAKDTFSFFNLLKDRFFKQAWLFMFLNISMGLVLIGSCASILAEANLAGPTIITIMALCGIFNGGGRLVFPLASDFIKNRLNIWLLVLLLEVVIMACSACWYAAIPVAIILINATYGAGFATLPSVLLDHYGTKNLSQIHGYVLSAWGFASLFAYFCTSLILTRASGYYFLTIVLAVIYALNLINVWSIKHLNTKSLKTSE